MENIKQPPRSESDTLLKLKSGCCTSVSQCEELLSMLSEKDYQADTEASSSIGGHVRHIVDRFQSFFQGLPIQQIDYDERARDKTIETSLESASFALASVQRRLESLMPHQIQHQNLVVCETVHQQGFTVQVSSTAERELMSLITHSIHHLAIIALLAKALGYKVDQSFGKAPSTVIFESL